MLQVPYSRRGGPTPETAVRAAARSPVRSRGRTSRFLPHRATILATLAAVWGAAAATAPPALAQEVDTARVEETPIELDRIPTEQSLESLTGEDAFPLQVTGFGVGRYSYEGRTDENSFAASKLALSLFHELSDHVWFFGQLTTLLEEPEGEGEGAGVVTEIEIDNLLVHFTPSGASGLSFAFGKFDTPIGFERDDEPLNLQPTESFNFELARPPKMTGVMGRWAAAPSLDLAAWVASGWEGDIDPNQGKTGGARIGLRPTENTSFGLAGLYGPEGEQDEENDRYLITLDYALEPGARLIVAGEASYGGDRDALEDGGDARWYGALLTVFGRLSRRVGVAIRGEVFRDRDGVRTGLPQTLESVTIAPVYFVGTGRQGIFANVEHTTFRMPRFQLRTGIRYDHSNHDVFETSEGLDDWKIEYIAELVATF